MNAEIKKAPEKAKKLVISGYEKKC